MLELKVTGDVGVDEDLGEFTRGDDELGDQVDCVVAVATELCWGLIRSLEVTIKLSKGWSQSHIRSGGFEGGELIAFSMGVRQNTRLVDSVNKHDV